VQDHAGITPVCLCDVHLCIGWGQHVVTILTLSHMPITNPVKLFSHSHMPNSRSCHILAYPLSISTPSLHLHNPFRVTGHGLRFFDPSKMAIFRQNQSIKGKSSEFFHRGHTIDVFCRNFMLICAITKKSEFIVPITENMHLFRCHFAPLWPRAPKF